MFPSDSMQTLKHPAACGSWPSPLSAVRIAHGGVRRMQPRIVGEAVYWLESRPAENGRSVLVCWRPDTGRVDITPAPFSVRSRVHEYGGGAYAVSGTTAFFVNDLDQQIYRVPVAGGAVVKLTAAVNCRFADLMPDVTRQHLVAVCEDHTHRSSEPCNSLVSVDIRDGSVQTLVSGMDFYSSPTLHPDGGRLAWLCWDHPHMPWDACELWLAEPDGPGEIKNSRRIAGGRGESIFQPLFAPDGGLHFISDRDGYWNIYKYTDGKIHALTRDAMDYGFAQWQFGMSSYGFKADGRLIATRLTRAVPNSCKSAPMVRRGAWRVNFPRSNICMRKERAWCCWLAIRCRSGSDPG